MIYWIDGWMLYPDKSRWRKRSEKFELVPNMEPELKVQRRSGKSYADHSQFRHGQFARMTRTNVRSVTLCISSAVHENHASDSISSRPFWLKTRARAHFAVMLRKNPCMFHTGHCQNFTVTYFTCQWWVRREPSEISRF